MGNPSFDFRQFSVQQDRCAMKVGTDGVLLGAWCLTHPACGSSSPSRILDIGAGTGLISLMLAQRFPEAGIDAVEIDSEAAQQCQENFAASPWSSRLHIHPCGLQDYHSERQYDLIVSNPPFYNATLKPEDAARASARHCDSLPVHEIIQYACRHLSPAGTLALIFPRDYETALMTVFAASGLTLSRICDVVTRSGKPAKRRMVELSSRPISLQTSTLTIRDEQNQYTPAYRALTEDFYLTLT